MCVCVCVCVCVKYICMYIRTCVRVYLSVHTVCEYGYAHSFVMYLAHTYICTMSYAYKHMYIPGF